MADAQNAGQDVGSVKPRLQVFLSYRREDSEAWTGRLYDALANRLGEDSLFMDIDDIPLGLDFVEVLEERLARCDAILAVIGRSWATLADGDGEPRLQDPDDFVRLEIEEGLRRKIPLIPVLVDGASLPKRDQLPGSCVPLVRRMAVRLTHEGFRGDIERIVRALEKVAGQDPPRPGPSMAAEQETPTGERAAETVQRLPESADTSYAEALRLHRAGDLAGAEAAYRQADEGGHAAAANNLGVLLKARGDAAGAEAAYRRADVGGHAYGAYNLGILLKARHDAAGAEAAFRRADERGDADGANQLGRILSRQGDLAGAEAAYRRADERGNGDGSKNLGVRLEERDDLDGAEAAYGRAAARGAENAQALLDHLKRRR